MPHIKTKTRRRKQTDRTNQADLVARRTKSQHKSKRKRTKDRDVEEAPSEGTLGAYLLREKTRKDRRRLSGGTALAHGRGVTSEEQTGLPSQPQRQRRLSGDQEHMEQRQRRSSNGPGESANQQRRISTGEQDQPPGGRRLSEQKNPAPQGQRRSSRQQDQLPGERQRRLSGGQEDHSAGAQPQQRRLSAGQGERRLSAGQGERRLSTGEQGKRRSSQDKRGRPESVQAEGAEQQRRQSVDENGQLKTNEVQRTLSDELAEKLVRERENASFKSRQTIMRRRKRRNPYANEYERHYATGAKVKQRHKQRRIKGA